MNNDREALEKLDIIKILSDSHQFFFSKFIIGRDDDFLDEDFHFWFCSFLMRPEKYKLILLPREHLKTTVGVVDNALWESTKNPAIDDFGEKFYNGNSLFFSHYVQSKSKETFHEIRLHLENNDLLHKYYPYLKIQKYKEFKTVANAERIYLRTLQPRKEPCFFSTSVESTNIGGHHDIFYIDDSLEIDKSENSPPIREKIRRFWTELMPLGRGRNRKMNIFGTTHEFNGMYTQIEKSAVADDQWTKLMKKVGMNFICIKKPMVFVKNGVRTAICPKIKTIDEMDVLRNPMLMGNKGVEAQYMLNPVPDEDMIFREEWFQFIKKDEIPGTVFKTWLLVDPATSKKKGAHYAAIIIVQVNEYADVIYRDYVIKQGLGSPGIVDEMFRLHRYWEPEKTLVEEYFGKDVTQWVKKQCEIQKYYIKADSFKYDPRSKEDRVAAAAPWFKEGKVYFMDWMRDGLLHRQTLNFHHGSKEFDDAPDCATRIFSKTVLKIPVARVEEKAPEGLSVEKMLGNNFNIMKKKYNLRNFGTPEIQKLN